MKSFMCSNWPLQLLRSTLTSTTSFHQSRGGSPGRLGTKRCPRPTRLVMLSPRPAGGPAGPRGSLLLAIRAPCGRRFEQHFEPTDTLLAVRASAEARYGVRYEEAFIETMAGPRRVLADLDMSLRQCGIVNRSMLRISQRKALEQERINVLSPAGCPAVDSGRLSTPSSP